MGTKSGNMAIVYSSIAVLSLLLLIGYLLWEKKKAKHMTMLFASVAVANVGYFLQSVSGTLNGALWANRVSYLGSAYLILLMLLIIMDVCQVERKPWMKGTLIAVSTAAFLLAASGGWNSLYYKAVAVVEINGMTRLVKEYGPAPYALSCLSAVLFCDDGFRHRLCRQKQETGITQVCGLSGLRGPAEYWCLGRGTGYRCGF